MTSREEGFLLLSCHFGNPDRKILTTAQLRTLATRVTGRDWTVRPGDLTCQDIAALGYDTGFSQRIVGLLGETDLLRRYLIRGEKAGCVPITRVSPDYPPLLRQRLGLDSSGCLWAKGNLDILHTPGIALVGSRDLKDRNREFAAAVGRYAAEKGFALVSGNARGADRTAQEAGDSFCRPVGRLFHRKEGEACLPGGPWRQMGRMGFGTASGVLGGGLWKHPLLCGNRPAVHFHGQGNQADHEDPPR